MKTAKRGKKLGQGTYGNVFIVEDFPYAVKTVYDKNIDVLDSAIREISSLISLKECKNICEIESFDEKNLDIYLERYDTDLNDGAIYPMDSYVIKKIMFQILNGVNNMRNRGIYHRDLKPGNILYNISSSEVGITDFGSSRSTLGHYRTIQSEDRENIEFTCEVGTVYTAAPEIVYNILRKKECEYTSISEIWSIGCIFAYLLRQGKYFFDGQSYQKQMALYMAHFGGDYKTTSFQEEYDKIKDHPYYSQSLSNKLFKYKNTPSEISLLEKMLQIDPLKRITLDEALRDPYFTGFIPNEVALSTLQIVMKADRGKFSEDEILIDSRRRYSLFSYIYKAYVSHKFRNPEILFSTFLYFDLYYVRKKHRIEDEVNVIICCYYLASIIYGVNGLILQDVVSLSGKLLDEKEARALSLDIFDKLKGDMYISTEYSYLSQHSEVNKNVVEMLLLALMDDQIRSYDKNEIANTIIGVVKKNEELINPQIQLLLKRRWRLIVDRSLFSFKDILLLS